MKKQILFLLFSAIAFAQPSNPTPFPNGIAPVTTLDNTATKLIAQKSGTDRLYYLNISSFLNNWNLTGENIRNNNIGNVEIQLRTGKKLSFLNNAGTEFGYLNINGSGFGNMYLPNGDATASHFYGVKYHTVNTGGLVSSDELLSFTNRASDYWQSRGLIRYFADYSTDTDPLRLISLGELNSAISEVSNGLDLQAVTDNGATTTNPVEFNDNVKIFNILDNTGRIYLDEGGITSIYGALYVYNAGDLDKKAAILGENLDQEVNLQLPNTSGTFAMSVNSTTADVNGNIELSVVTEVNDTPPNSSGQVYIPIPFQSLTTAGTSGAATLSAGNLNVPRYDQINLTQVLANGSSGATSGTISLTGNTGVYLNASGSSFGVAISGGLSSTNKAKLLTDNLTGDRDFQFPNASGRIVIDSELAAKLDLNNPTPTGTLTLPGTSNFAISGGSANNILLETGAGANGSVFVQQRSIGNDTMGTGSIVSSDSFRTAVWKLQPFKGSSIAFDFPSIPANSTATTTITVTGAVQGQPVVMGTTIPYIHGVFYTAIVTAANTVTIYAANTTGSAKDPASGDIRVEVSK